MPQSVGRFYPRCRGRRRRRSPASRRCRQIILEWRTTVIRNTKVQMLAVLAVGALLGYLAASGRFISPQVEASGVSLPAIAAPIDPGCCDVNKGNLLAMAQADGKQ